MPYSGKDNERKSRGDKVFEMSKKGNAVKIKRSEIQYYRLLAVVVALFAVITGIQYSGGREEAYPTFALALTICFGALALAAVVLAIVGAKKKSKKSKAVFGSSFLAGLFLCLTGAFAALWSGVVSSRRLMLYVTLCALVYLVYSLFDRETFSFSVYTLVGGVVLSLLRNALAVEKTILVAIIVVYALAAIILTTVGRNRNIKIGGQLIYGKKFKAYPYYISAGILLAGVVMSYVIAGSVIYSLAVLGVYYLIYTVVGALSNM